MAVSNLMNKSFLTRAISGILLVIIIAVTAIIGGDLLFGTVFVVSMIGLFEVYRVGGIEKSIIAVPGYIATVIYFLLNRFADSNHFTAFAVGFMIVVMAVYVFTFPKYSAEKMFLSYFGVLYAPVMMSFMYQVREYNEDGIFTFWMIFICSWICDTFAYLTGVVCGKNKMAPILSPKKTIEGAIGGVVGAAIVGAIYGTVVGGKLETIDNAAVLFAVIGACGGLISMIGDLFASAIKRNYDIKDYGKLIPGHGGIMDRFDSVIITSPLIYFLLVYFA